METVRRRALIWEIDKVRGKRRVKHIDKVPCQSLRNCRMAVDRGSFGMTYDALAEKYGLTRAWCKQIVMRQKRQMESYFAMNDDD